MTAPHIGISLLLQRKLSIREGTRPTAVHRSNFFSFYCSARLHAFIPFLFQQFLLPIVHVDLFALPLHLVLANDIGIKNTHMVIDQTKSINGTHTIAVRPLASKSVRFVMTRNEISPIPNLVKSK